MNDKAIEQYELRNSLEIFKSLTVDLMRVMYRLSEDNLLSKEEQDVLERAEKVCRSA